MRQRLERKEGGNGESAKREMSIQGDGNKICIKIKSTFDDKVA